MRKDEIIIDIIRVELNKLGINGYKIYKYKNSYISINFRGILSFREADSIKDRLEKILPGRVQCYRFLGKIVIYSDDK